MNFSLQLEQNTPENGKGAFSVFSITLAVIFFFHPGSKLLGESFFQPSNEVQKPFTVVILPDTQGYLYWKSPKRKVIFESQIQWIQDHALDQNISMVIHLGDIVMSNKLTEWEMARDIFSSLDDWIPYVLTVGNHDATPEKNSKGTELFNHWFPVKRFASFDYLGGVFEPEKLDNAFYFFKGGLVNYMVVTLEFAPRDEVLEWANNIIANYPNHKVFIVTHAYLGSNNKRLAAGDSCNLHYNETVSGQPFLTSNDGEEIWEKLGRHHKNIQFILSGHVLGGGTGHIVSFGENGNTVFQITSNYQNLPNGGNGFLRTMEFLPENKIQVKTYSPYLDIYKTDAKNQFVIDLNRNLYKKE